MHNISRGFILEFEKISGLANVGISALRNIGKIKMLRNLAKRGISGLRKTKSYESVPERNLWKHTKENPFSESKPWKELRGYQKARIVAGIGGNLAMVAPFAMGNKHEDTVSNAGN